MYSHKSRCARGAGAGNSGQQPPPRVHCVSGKIPGLRLLTRSISWPASPGLGRMLPTLSVGRTFFLSRRFIATGELRAVAWGYIIASSLVGAVGTPKLRVVSVATSRRLGCRIPLFSPQLSAVYGSLADAGPRGWRSALHVPPCAVSRGAH